MIVEYSCYFKTPVLLFFIFLTSCASGPPPEDPFELLQIFPPEKVIVEEEEEVEEVEEVEEIEPVYTMGSIAEIEIVQGVQKYIYLKMPDEASGLISPNQEGELFSDDSLVTKIGSIRIQQEFPGYYYAEILDLIYPINRNSVVRIQIDEEIKESNDVSLHTNQNPDTGS